MKLAIVASLSCLPFFLPSHSLTRVADMQCMTNVNSTPPSSCGEWTCTLGVSALMQMSGPDCNQCTFSFGYKLKCTKPGVAFAYLIEGTHGPSNLPCPEKGMESSSITFNCPGGAGTPGSIDMECRHCMEQ